MFSGPSEMYILAKDNAIVTWRKLMGPTKVYKTKITHPDTIRGKYGISDTRNATHGSGEKSELAGDALNLLSDIVRDKLYRFGRVHEKGIRHRVSRI